MKLFTHGILVNTDTMMHYCPDAERVCDAILRGYEKRPGNVVENANAFTKGVLWEIPDECLNSLDDLEGYPDWYKRKSVVVETPDGDVEALVYYIPTEKE